MRGYSLSSTSDFLKIRIEAIKTQIEAYEQALTTFATSNVQSYTLDTGQTRQTVQRAEISSMKNTVKSLYSLLDDLDARVNGASVILRPLR